MNTLKVTGRLVRAVEHKTYKDGNIVKTREGKTVAGSSVADQHSKKEGDVSFFKFVMYGEPADTAIKQFAKGDLVQIEGWMKQNRWTDKTTGKGRSDWEMRVQEIYPVLPKSKTAPPSDDDVPAWAEPDTGGCPEGLEE